MMKNIKTYMPAIAVAIAIAGTAFTTPAEKASTSEYTYEQQDYPYEQTNVNDVTSWTDVTAAVDGDPVGYTDDQSNCHWSSTVVCVAAFYNDNPIDVYDGISQLF